MLKILIFLLVVCLFAVSLFAIPTIAFIISHYVRGDRFPVRQFPSEWSEHCLIRKLIIDFPNALVNDLFNRNPDAFPFDETGLVIFEGEQGSGKSVGAVWYINRLKKLYPKVSIMSNINLNFADKHMENFEDIIFNENGVYGQICFVDEIHNYFSSADSKNFPAEMLSEVCQQRKQRKTIIGTVQVFGRCAKPIREQTRYLVRPRTLLGCFTILSVFRPTVDEDGKVTKLFREHTFCFAHTPFLRSAYDTYEIVKRHALVSYKDKIT